MTTNSQDQAEQELKKLEFQFEIFKLEYEQAAQRFENIYQAIWQIFSYLTAIAAAIVAFGANNLSISLVVVIALLPLLFWLLAIYIPMDFYGHRVGARLAEMEEGFNEKFIKDYPDTLKLKLFEDFKKPTKVQRNFLRFKRYLKWLKLRFLRWLKLPWENLNNPWQTHWRVRYAISVFAIVAVVVWFLFLCITIKNFSQLEADPSKMEIRLEPPVQVQTQDVQLLQGLESKLDLLFTRLDKIESLLRARNIATPNNNIGKPGQ